MEKIVVDGGYPLSGKVDISGMKNANETRSKFF